MGDMRKAYRSLVGKPERKRPIGRFGLNLSGSSRDQCQALVNILMNLQVP
jgi:hypothetical protein